MVERVHYTLCVDHLGHVRARMKLLFIEPLLGLISYVDLTAIDWAIAGGESGPRAPGGSCSWLTKVLNQCVRADVQFLFKQWGRTNKKKIGRVLERLTWDWLQILPAYRQVRFQC